MNKTRLLSIAVIGLLLLNFGILSVLLYHHEKPGPPSHREPKYIIIERLGLDEKQQESYQVLIDAHRKRHRQLNDSCQDMKNNLYGLLKQVPADHQKADSLIRNIAQVQEKLEHVNFEHFQQIRALCRPEQIPAFNLLLSDLAGLFAPPHPPKHERR